MKATFRRVACHAALKGGSVIKASLGKTLRISRKKGRNNIVTDVDRKAERVVVGTIRAAFPSHSILSEELGAERDRKSVV